MKIGDTVRIVNYKDEKFNGKVGKIIGIVQDTDPIDDEGTVMGGYIAVVHYEEHMSGMFPIVNLELTE